MSWANIASKNPSNVDIASKNPSNVDIASKNPSNVDIASKNVPRTSTSTIKIKPMIGTVKSQQHYPPEFHASIGLSSPQQIHDILRSHFINDIADLIKGYTVFAMDLSWCDLNPYLYLLDKDPQGFREMGPSNKVEVGPDKMHHEVDDRAFVEMFHIDDKYGIECQVHSVNMDRCDHYGSHTVFRNRIVFKDQRWAFYFSFYLSDLRFLIQINDCEEFESYLEKEWRSRRPVLAVPYIEPDPVLWINFHDLSTSDNEQMMKCLQWEFWRKIIAPKYVLDNLDTLTGYKFNDLYQKDRQKMCK